MKIFLLQETWHVLCKWYSYLQEVYWLHLLLVSAEHSPISDSEKIVMRNMCSQLHLCSSSIMPWHSTCSFIHTFAIQTWKKLQEETQRRDSSPRTDRRAIDVCAERTSTVAESGSSAIPAGLCAANYVYTKSKEHAASELFATIIHVAKWLDDSHLHISEPSSVSYVKYLVIIIFGSWPWMPYQLKCNSNN